MLLKFLLDGSIDQNLRNYFPGHTVRHVIDKNWQDFKVGELMAAADLAKVDVFITADTEMPYQQTMKGRTFALVVLDIHPNTLKAQVACSPEIIRLIEKMRQGNIYLVAGPHTKRPEKVGCRTQMISERLT